MPYLPKEQTVPILRGEGEDLTVKIKVFFLTANAEVIEDKMGHIHPGETLSCQDCRSQGSHEVEGWGMQSEILEVLRWGYTEVVPSLAHQRSCSLLTFSGPP